MRQLYIGVYTVSQLAGGGREILRGNQADKHDSRWVMCCRASSRAVFQIRSDLIGSEIDKRELGLARRIISIGLDLSGVLKNTAYSFRSAARIFIPFLSFSSVIFCHKNMKENDESDRNVGQIKNLDFELFEIFRDAGHWREFSRSLTRLCTL